MIDRFTMPKLGARVPGFEDDYKPCGMGYAGGKLWLCTCNNVSRRHSRVYYYDGESEPVKIHDDVLQGTENETIGNPYEAGNYVGFVGENGKVWSCHNGEIKLTPWFSTRFANAMAKLDDCIVVLDTDDGKISIRHCYDPDAMRPAGTVIGTMPGSGIALAACEYHSKLYAAVADSEDGGHGLSCIDGKLIKLPGCQCVIPFAGDLVYSSMNGVYTLKLGLVTRLDCEKIMDMKSAGNSLYIAGANPDSVWVANTRGEIALVGVITTGNSTVGGSCFRVRVAVNSLETEGYFARTADGNRGEVYQIVWG